MDWPSAGYPEVNEGVFEFPVDPDEFAAEMLRYRDMGARVLGGCCGTGPDHVRPESPLRRAGSAG